VINFELGPRLVSPSSVIKFLVAKSGADAIVQPDRLRPPVAQGKMETEVETFANNLQQVRYASLWVSERIGPRECLHASCPEDFQSA